MRGMKKMILATVSGVVLAVGTAGAAPPAPVDAGDPAAKKNIKSAIKIKEDAKPGKKLMDNNIASKPGPSVKTKEDAKPGQQTTTSLKVNDGAKSGKNMELTRR